MSYLKTINIQHLTSGTNNIVLDANGNMTCAGTISAATPTGGMRNKIINGDMRIDQRNAGASLTPSNQAYTVDRWYAGLTQSSKFSVQQNAGSVTPPAGFSNYLGVTSLSTYSTTSGDTFYVGQKIEGYNLSDLAYGTSSAKSVTISFWAYSSLTGTFGGSLHNPTNLRSYLFSYSIPTSNTWTYISITIPGDAISSLGGTVNAGLILWFGLGSNTAYSGTAGSWLSGTYVQPSGTISLVGTNGATWYITGVQLEVGTVATAFERRQYGTELALCQRYYEKSYDDSIVPGTASTNGQVLGIRSNGAFTLWSKFLVTKRTTPTITLYSPATGASAKVRNLNSGADETGSTSAVGFSGFNAGGTGATVSEGYSMHWIASAEL